MKTGIYWQDPKYAVGRCRNDPGCVLYLPLHRLDGASFMSKDAYGHLCVVTGALWTADGRLFDGIDDYIEIPDAPSLDLTDAITIEVWIKPILESAAHGRYVAKSGAYYLGQHAADETMVRWEISGFSPTVLNTATGIVIVDAFNHIVGTYNRLDGGNNRKIYVNAIEQASDAQTATIPTNANVIHLGNLNTIQNVQNYKGIISEVRIYNRALSPVEVQRNYLATKWRYR